MGCALGNRFPVTCPLSSTHYWEYHHYWPEQRCSQCNGECIMLVGGEDPPDFRFSYFFLFQAYFFFFQAYFFLFQAYFCLFQGIFLATMSCQVYVRGEDGVSREWVLLYLQKPAKYSLQCSYIRFQLEVSSWVTIIRL